MKEKGKMERDVVELVNTESLVPPDHLLRKVDKAVDFRKLYEIVEPLYSEEEGRPSVDPVVLFKIVLLQHLDGIPSLRGTLRRAQTDIAYRWFFGYTLNEELPHFSTVSYNFRHRFTEETIEAVFQWVLNEAGTAGALSPAAVFIDGTHIKASANLNKKLKQEVPAAAKRYRAELLAEINADRESHGKRILPTRRPISAKKVFDDGRVLSTACKRPMTMKGGHEWWKYVYDEYYDCVICPEYQPLAYRTTNRDGYREYCSNPKICAQCPTRQMCTRSKNCVKTVLRHVWKDYEELADDARYTPRYRDLYSKRKETIERVFADAKQKHGMRYTLYRGLAQVFKWVRLKFAAMNLKKLARWKAKRHSRLSFLLFSASAYL